MNNLHYFILREEVLFRCWRIFPHKYAEWSREPSSMAFYMRWKNCLASVSSVLYFHYSCDVGLLWIGIYLCTMYIVYTNTLFGQFACVGACIFIIIIIIFILFTRFWGIKTKNKKKTIYSHKSKSHLAVQ